MCGCSSILPLSVDTGSKKVKCLFVQNISEKPITVDMDVGEQRGGEGQAALQAGKQSRWEWEVWNDRRVRM